MTKVPSIKSWINSRRYEMPHYKNGRLAKVGDIAVGTTFNRQGFQIGVIVGITPNSEACNCRLATSFNSLPISYDCDALIPVPARLENNYTASYDSTDVNRLLHIEDHLASLVPNPVVVTNGDQIPTL